MTGIPPLGSGGREAAGEPVFEPLEFNRLTPLKMHERALAWYEELDRRRTTRDFSAEPVPRELVALAIRSAGTAPSGAHRQPWTFVVVDDPAIKQQIRAAAETEEHRTYTERTSDEWRVAGSARHHCSNTTALVPAR